MDAWVILVLFIAYINQVNGVLDNGTYAKSVEFQVLILTIEVVINCKNIIFIFLYRRDLDVDHYGLEK
jgi:hypothetical protein